jgi:hypothetical protein
VTDQSKNERPLPREGETGGTLIFTLERRVEWLFAQSLYWAVPRALPARLGCLGSKRPRLRSVIKPGSPSPQAEAADSDPRLDLAPGVLATEAVG